MRPWIQVSSQVARDTAKSCFGLFLSKLHIFWAILNSSTAPTYRGVRGSNKLIETDKANWSGRFTITPKKRILERAPTVLAPTAQVAVVELLAQTLDLERQHSNAQHGWSRVEPKATGWSKKQINV